MGYDLHITRRKYHFDDEGPAISESEWRALVESDPELSFSNDGNGPLFATWNGECKYPDPWFAYSADNGSINTKNPDEKIIAKMLEIAARLGAKVQGDDGEVYRTPTEAYEEEDEQEQGSEVKLPWWKRWLG
ncbi:hypothetical protein [Bremerella sp.]|uniref:hypothetical protein n=1 Tax=Bremerella sp. TaxID=2795602 RepID=UPI00391A2167